MSEPQRLPSDRPRGFERDREGGASRWPEQPRPVVVVEQSRQQRGLLDVLLRLLAVVVLILIVALLGALLLVALSLSTVGDRIGGVGETVGQIGESARRAAQSTVDRLDPAHPPRNPLFLDTEFDDLKRVGVGNTLAQTSEYTLTLVEIEKREGASNPSEAQYAVVRRRLIVPRETRILGRVIRTDYDEADYYLYKGESFRLGRAYYKVNWVSVERQEIAVARYRNADDLTAPLKFQLD